MTDYEYIASRTTKETALCLLAEEAAELGHAALKLRRALSQDCPTPKTAQDARDNLLEEIADVLNAVNVFRLTDDVFSSVATEVCTESIMYVKCKRWVDRLRAAEYKTKEGGENAEEDKLKTERRTI